MTWAYPNKLSSDLVDEMGLEVPGKHGGVGYVMALKDWRVICVNAAQQALSWIGR
jgi:hypothetical protein